MQSPVCALRVLDNCKSIFFINKLITLKFKCEKKCIYVFVDDVTVARLTTICLTKLLTILVKLNKINFQLIYLFLDQNLPVKRSGLH